MAENIINKVKIGSTEYELEATSLSGLTATTTELNYVDGVTSNIQTQLNGKASTATATTSTAGLMSAADKTKLNNAATLSDIEAYVNEAILGGTW